MPADLIVTSIRLPSPLRAPCPLQIQVSIQNVGSDAANPVPFDVTIEIGGGDTPSVRFEAVVTTPEDQRLSPGRTLVVPVTVQFPCTSPVNLRATVDLKHQVANNQRSAPSQILTALTTTPVPWLTTALGVGIRDSAGMVTFNPDGFCPGKDVLAEITITNKGCTASQPSTTEVTLEDPNASPSPTMLGSQRYLVPALNPGLNHMQLLSFATPGSAAGTSGTLGVRVSADAKFSNPDQCDRASLGAWIAKAFSAGAAPRLALTVGGAGVIRPGEVPALSWSVHNDCSEIGTADVRILYGAPSTEIYKTTLAIPLRSTVGEDLKATDITIPMMIASAFWTIGTQSLQLEVTGNGANRGPFRIVVTMNVIPEPIDSTWWTWGMSPAALWKTTYAVTGTFSNQGLASMTVRALTALEHPTDVVGTGEDATVTPLSTVFTSIVMPGSSVGATFVRFQAWSWLATGTVVEVGPRSRPFSYIASFSVTDVFGNAYPAVVSAPTTVTVSISGRKISDRAGGGAMIGVGLGFLVAAAYVGATGGPYGWIGAVVLAGIGMALIIGGQFLLYSANDPPIPDFRESGPALADPRAWNIPNVDDPSLQAVRTLALLVARVISAQLRASHYKDRAWAAFLDRNESARIERRDAGRNELETLRRLVSATIDATDEAHEMWEKLLSEVRSLPNPEKLAKMSHRFADDLGLTDNERVIVNERLKLLDKKELRQAFEHARADGLQHIGELVRNIHETMTAKFAELEYLS